MTDVIDRLAAAVNAHDLDAVAGLIHEDYRSEQRCGARCNQQRAEIPPVAPFIRGCL
jgi:hypothetical protein